MFHKRSDWNPKLSRRTFLKSSALLTFGLATRVSFGADSGQKVPNIILLMADDLGYGDVGFNGNKVIKTSNLDEMAKNGVKFSRFYAAAPVCSPTRATCLTGRHYLRYGIFSASIGYLPAEEITLAKMCKSLGYTTGHFGKWHLGPITKKGQTLPEYYENRLRKYAPPWERDYDQSFTTVCNVPTCNPSDNARFDKDSQLPFFYNGEMVKEKLEGPACRLVMDHAISFIRQAKENKQPFFITIWFHEPHEPVVACHKYRKMYENFNYHEQNYYGCITAMDEQIGRLRRELRELGLAKSTMVWFCSDNGPEVIRKKGEPFWRYNSCGITAGLRGAKRSLFEGGIRVPALLEWPGQVEPGCVINTPCSTMDYFPTIQEVLNYKIKRKNWPIDGISILPLIKGQMTTRPKPIPFCLFWFDQDIMFGSPKLALIDNNFKFLTNLSKDGHEDLLFDLSEDPFEKRNIIEKYPERAAKMKAIIKEWLASCKASHSGADYDTPFTPVNHFPIITDEGIKKY